MPVPYSQDLRDRVLAACDRAMKTKTIADLFGVSRSWVRRVKQRRREHGEVSPRPPEPPVRHAKIDRARLRDRLPATPLRQPPLSSGHQWHRRSRGHWCGRRLVLRVAGNLLTGARSRFGPFAFPTPQHLRGDLRVPRSIRSQGPARDWLRSRMRPGASDTAPRIGVVTARSDPPGTCARVASRLSEHARSRFQWGPDRRARPGFGTRVRLEARCRHNARRRQVGARAVQGNLDPTLVFAPTEVMLARAAGILEAGRAARGHIFNLGHGVLPTTDPDQLQRLTEFVHSFSYEE